MTDLESPEELHKKAELAAARWKARIAEIRKNGQPMAIADAELEHHVREAKAEYREGLRNGSIFRPQPDSPRDPKADSVKYPREKPKQSR